MAITAAVLRRSVGTPARRRGTGSSRLLSLGRRPCWKLVALAAIGLALARGGGAFLAGLALRPLAGVAPSPGARRLGLACAATKTPRSPARTAGSRKAPSDASSSPLIPTDKASFLAAAQRPSVLSPDGLRTAGLEVRESGLVLVVEAAPLFGPTGTVAALATDRDVVDPVTIIPTHKLGTMGVTDFYWLDDRRFLIIGFDGSSSQTYGWVADLRQLRATLIAMPSRDASLFVLLGANSRPLMRLDERGSPEVLLGFTTGPPTPQRQLAWYSVANGDLVDAAEDEQLPSRLWREVLLSDTGRVEALLLTNGTVQRRTPEGWRDLGAISLAIEEGEGVADTQAVQHRKYLVSLGPDFSVFAVDKLKPDSCAPQAHPPAEHLGGRVPDGDSQVASWVLRESHGRQTAALVHVTADGSTPRPLFAHPFADILADGVWLDPQTGWPEAVMVEDLQSHAYALSHAGGELLRSLRERLPQTVMLDGTSFDAAVLEPQVVIRHTDRWLAYYGHPALTEYVVLPVLAEAGRVTWIGDKALPIRGCASTAEAINLGIRVEGERLPATPGMDARGDVPVYLVLPPEDPTALVVRVHEGPDRRDGWGADGVDSWLVSRGYGVLKVNYRGSSGFGLWWSDEAPGAQAGEGFLDDIAAAVQWALHDRKVLGTAPGAQPAVAVLGSYFGGYAALQAMVRHQELFACGIALAPIQALPRWPDTFIPDAASRRRVEELRGTAEVLDASAESTAYRDPARLELSPVAHAQALGGLPVLVVEYERDSLASRDDLLSQVAPLGCPLEHWPSKLRLVQYAGESSGGGTVRQNVLDQYRRIDAFLYENLAPLAGEDSIRHEVFVDELPFLSASVLPAFKANVSSTLRSIETALEEGLREKEGAAAAASLPELAPAAAGTGFGGPAASAKPGRRRALPYPASRIAVRGDGTVEVTVVFPKAPQALHALLSEVWLHIRAEGTALTVALPRRPIGGEAMRGYRLPEANAFLFEVPAYRDVGAIENYQQWAARGGDGAPIMSVLWPQDIRAAPVAVPTGIIDV